MNIAQEIQQLYATSDLKSLSLEDRKKELDEPRFIQFAEEHPLLFEDLLGGKDFTKASLTAYFNNYDLELARAIRDICFANPKSWFEKPLEERQQAIDQAKYVEFAKRHPVVTRKILDGEFDEKAFLNYLREVEKGHSSKTQWADRQASYAKFLAYSKGANSKEANQAAKDMKKLLMLEPPRPKNPDETDARDVAIEMWHTWKDFAKDPKWLEKKYQEREIDFRVQGYGDFMKKYNVPSRYLIEFGQFNLKCFERYLLKLRTKGFRTQEEWAEREADYAKYLWMANNPHGSKALADEVYQETRKRLIDEVKKFKEDYETAKGKVEGEQKEADKSVKKDLEMLAAGDPAMRERLQKIMETFQRLPTKPAEDAERKIGEKPQATEVWGSQTHQTVLRESV